MIWQANPDIVHEDTKNHNLKLTPAKFTAKQYEQLDI